MAGKNMQVSKLGDTKEIHVTLDSQVCPFWWQIFKLYIAFND